MTSYPDILIYNCYVITPLLWNLIVYYEATSIRYGKQWSMDFIHDIPNILSDYVTVRIQYKQHSSYFVEMFRAVANTTASNGAVCRLFFAQVC